MLVRLRSRFFKAVLPVLMTLLVVTMLAGFSIPAMAAASTSTKSPSSGTSVIGLSKSWSNPDRIIADDGSNASAEMNYLYNKTNYLKASGFNFAIPTAATINGIQVEIGRYCSNSNSIKDETVQLFSIIGMGDDKADKTNYWPTSKVPKNYGGASDKWGISDIILTPGFINDSNFGVVLSVSKSGTSTKTAYVDYIRITVTYNDDATAPTGSISINGGADSCTSTSVTLNLSASDAIGVTGYRVSNSLIPSGSATNITAATSYNGNVPWTLSDGLGPKIVTVQYCDAAGNWSSIYADGITLTAADTTAPSGSLSINLGLSSTTNPSVTLNLSATDAVGVTGYRVADGNDASGASTIAVNSILVYLDSIPWTLPAGTGEKTVAVQYRDAAGNWSPNCTDSIELVAPPDITAPAGSISINGGADSSTSTGVTLSLSATDAVGITGYKVFNGLIPSGDVTYITSTTGYNADIPWTLTAGNGLKIVTVQYCDAAGNWSIIYSDSITLSLPDTTDPTGSLSINLGLSSTTSTSVTLYLSATDAVGVTGYRVADGSDASGESTVNITSTLVYLDSIPWILPAGTGEKTVAVQYCDAAGNWSENYTDSIELTAPLDIIAPAGSITINNGDDSCTGTDVTLSLSATDAVGVTGYKVFNGIVPSGDVTDITPTAAYSEDIPWTLSAGTGLKTVSVQYFDAAENGSISYIDLILLDNAPVAVDDSYTISEGATLGIPAPGVMFNDSDIDEDSLISYLVSGTSHGLLLLAINGAFAYTPDGGYSGPDSFTYKLTDGYLDSNIATVTINVDAVGSQSWMLFEDHHNLSNELHIMQPDGDPSGSVTLTPDNYWLTTDPADGGVNFDPGIWKVHLVIDSTIGVHVTIGYWVVGEGFHAFEGSHTEFLDGDGYAYFNLSQVTVNNGDYLALRVNCQGLIVTTEGGSYLSAPPSTPLQALPEAGSVVLLGAGLLCMAGFVVYRRRQLVKNPR